MSNNKPLQIFILLAITLVSCSKRAEYKRKWNHFGGLIEKATHNYLHCSYYNDDSGMAKYSAEMQRFHDSSEKYWHLIKLEDYKYIRP